MNETAELLVQALDLGHPQIPQPSLTPPTTNTRNSSRNARSAHSTINGAYKCPDHTARRTNTFCDSVLPSPTCTRKLSCIWPYIIGNKLKFLSPSPFMFAGKRSVDQIESNTTDSIPLDLFDLNSYRAAVPSRHQRSCHANAPRYVLFILDTSGSIDPVDFEDAKKAVATIANSLCGYIKVALMSFSDVRYLDFCFDCYPDQRQPRQAIYDAIMNTPYRDGGTYTADAIKCACQHMLTPACGVKQGLFENIHVVILTDGDNNGPCSEKLVEVSKCLSDQATIDIFAIAIGSGTTETVANLVKHPDYNHIFKVDTFAELLPLVNSANLLAQRRFCLPHTRSMPCPP